MSAIRSRHRQHAPPAESQPQLQSDAKLPPQSDSPPPSPFHQRRVSGDEVVDEEVPVVKIESTSRKSRSRSTFIFVLGGLFGLLLAAFFASQTKVANDFLQDLSFDAFVDKLPAGMVNEARDMMSHEKETTNYDSFSIGLALLDAGLRAKHPVVMVG